MGGLYVCPPWFTRPRASANLVADFNEPKGALLGIMNAVLPLGAVFGAIPAAWICDRYGRRVALMTGDVIMLVAAALQTASLNGQCSTAVLVIGRWQGHDLIICLQSPCTWSPDS